MDDRRDFEARRDDQFKLLGLKAWEGDALAPGEKAADGLFTDLLPRVRELRREQGRFGQRVALLRHVEALRMFAATHNGKFPTRAAEIGVPLPDDPFTGKPFALTLSGEAVALRAGAPKGEEGNPNFGARYEVTIGSPAPAKPGPVDPRFTQPGILKK
ncbi:MAG TPA: hypothetical protein VGE74_26935 [Gemmata sp.]